MHESPMLYVIDVSVALAPACVSRAGKRQKLHSGSEQKKNDILSRAGTFFNLEEFIISYVVYLLVVFCCSVRLMCQKLLHLAAAASNQKQQKKITSH